MATTYLTRTPGSEGNRKTWTLSGWYKRSKMGESAFFMSVGQWSVSQLCQALFEGDDKLNVGGFTSGGGTDFHLESDRRFRDPAAWYHVVIAVDTTQATAGDRVKMYVNGEQLTTFTTETYPSLNYDCAFNDTEATSVGRRNGTANCYNGVMAHVHFIDGTAYAPSDFGETDSTSGIWIAKTSPSVTYGTNGFFLKFASGSPYEDSSGNNNDFTLGAGTLTQTKDTPDNNFCTLNPLNKNHSGALTNGNTTGTTAADAVWRSTFSTMGAASGKWYWEGKCVSEGAYTGIGVASIKNMTAASGNSNFAHLSGGFAYQDDGVANNQSSESSYGDTYTTGDIIGVACDATNGNMWFSKNGTWQNSATIAEIAAGTTTNAAFTGMASTTYLPTVKFYNGTTWSMNYGNGYFGTTSHGETNADDAGIGLFKYDVPGGYYSLCTTNLGDQS